MKHAKQITAVAVFVTALFLSGKAQITLEHTYENTGETLLHTYLADGNVMYVHHDETEETMSLYSTNHSLYKTIDYLSIIETSGICPTGNFNSSSESLGYITDKLFNQDEKVEFVVTFICYENTTWTRHIIIANEDCNILFSDNGSIDSWGHVYSGINFAYIFNTPSGAKMKIYHPDDHKTKIYSLPGTLPAQIEITSGNPTEMAAYPNPVQGAFTLSYNTQGIHFGQLSITDINGHEVASRAFYNGEGNIHVDTSTLAAGTYAVSLVSGGKVLGTRKIVVTK